MAKAKFIGESKTLSSGVTVTVIPFPMGLLQRINTDNPDPVPPKKTIEVLGGTEEVDNLKDKDYLEGVQLATNKRNSLLGEAVIELCVEIDLSKYTKEIKTLEKFTSPYPVDLDERRMRFLMEYAFRTKGDYEWAMGSAIAQIAISDEEVQERIATFQSDLSRPATNGASTSGAAKTLSLEVESS